MPDDRAGSPAGLIALTAGGLASLALAGSLFGAPAVLLATVLKAAAVWAVLTGRAADAEQHLGRALAADALALLTWAPLVSPETRLPLAAGCAGVALTALAWSRARRLATSRRRAWASEWQAHRRAAEERHRASRRPR